MPLRSLDTSEAGDRWREKYLTQLDEIESKENHWRHVEQGLHQSIGRLALALYGRDAALDRCVNALRDTLRASGSDANEIGRQVGDIVDLVERLDQRQNATAWLAEVLPEGIEQLCTDLGMRTAHVKKFVAKTRSVSHPSDLLRLLTDIATDLGRNPIGDGTGTSSPSMDVAGAARLMSQLIDKLDLPDEDGIQLGQVREQLGRPDAGVEVIAEATTELVRAVRGMRKELEAQRVEIEGFLLGLNQTLVDLGQVVSDLESKLSGSVDSLAAWRASWNNDVTEFQNEVSRANDLPTLKSMVHRGIESLSLRLERFVDSQDAEQHSQREAALTLGRALSAAKNESAALRDQLENAKANALIDGLTGLANRRALDLRIEEEVARWSRSRQPLGVLIGDVDHFKRINDSYGHQAGDRVLKAIAAALQDRLRGSDFIARYGGEEFAVLMPDTEVGPALRLAEELRRTIESARFSYQGQPVNVTISMGVTGLQDGDDAESALRRADDALYAAKAAGRNRSEAA